MDKLSPENSYRSLYLRLNMLSSGTLLFPPLTWKPFLCPLFPDVFGLEQREHLFLEVLLQAGDFFLELTDMDGKYSIW